MQARAACIAFPYMFDAQLMAEAVMDASKGGEAAYKAWMATQTQQMYAIRAARLGSHQCTASASVDSAAAATAPRTAIEAAAMHTAAPADGVVPATKVHCSTDVTPVTQGGEGALAGKPLTLSQLAAWNVSDVLQRAGPRSPQAAPGRPRGPFDRRLRQ